MLSIGLEIGQLSYIPHVFMNRSCILVIDHGRSEVPALEAVSWYCPNLDSKHRIGICLFLWRFMGTGQRAALLKWLRVRMGFRWAELLIGQHKRIGSVVGFCPAGTGSRPIWERMESSRPSLAMWNPAGTGQQCGSLKLHRSIGHLMVSYALTITTWTSLDPLDHI